jgi:hypothetical protein
MAGRLHSLWKLQVAASCKLPRTVPYQVQQDATCRYRGGCLLVMLQGELAVDDRGRVFVYGVWVSGSVTQTEPVSI